MNLIATPPVSRIQKRYYGWKVDKYDSRDLHKTFTTLRKDVKKVDLREQCPVVYDQGQLGSCTANAISGMYEFDMIKEKEKNIFTPSRLFIYYNERKMEGSISQDAGAEIRDGIKSVGKVGIVNEKEWPYDISKFTNEPPQNLYNEAKHHIAVKYKRIKQDLDHMKECLNQGFPFVFGFMVYESFETQEVANTGKMPMPKKDEKVLGGHAVMAVGFNTDTNEMIIRNSWSDKWGDNGYFTMPFEFIKNSDYCSDFWCIERVQDDDKRD
jgi:C1A family cysteine protease